MGIKVWMLDPAAMSPHYDLSLTRALLDVGTDIHLLTSRFLHEERVPLADEYARYLFFRPLEKWPETLRRRTWPRRIGRVATYPLGLHRLWRAFRRDPPDVLHVQWLFLPRLDAPLIRHLARSTPLVLTVHNPLLRDPQPTRQGDLRSLYGAASAIIVHAEQNREVLLRHPGVDPRKVAVIAHGPLFEEQAVPTRAQARAALGLAAEAQVILFFGLIRRYKGLDDLIKALAHLRRTVPQAHLLVAGQPHGSMEPYLRIIAAHDLEAATTLHTRYVPSGEVPRYFAAANVVCTPYREASQSGVLMSAYRFGRPVVVTEVGGLAESVEEGCNGFAVPPADPEALAAALGRLLSDPVLQEAFGARSLELAQNRFSWSQAARLTRAIYERVVAAGGSLAGPAPGSDLSHSLPGRRPN